MIRRRGFTVVELLLVIGILAILAASTPVALGSFQSYRSSDTAVQSIAQTLRNAQLRAQAVESDTSWGVKIQSSSITLFRGSSYAARDTAYDEELSVSDTLTLGGLSEVVFAKRTGKPGITGNITVTSDYNSKTITINSKGALQYD